MSTATFIIHTPDDGGSVRQKCLENKYLQPASLGCIQILLKDEQKHMIGFGENKQILKKPLK